MRNTDVRALVEAGLFKDALAEINSYPTKSLEHRIAAADLEAHVGDPVRAAANAKKLLRENLSHEDRALCHEVIGRVAMTSGQLDDGLRAIRTGVNAAAQAQSPKLEARLFASHAAILLHCGALEAAAEEVNKLRRACIANGDPQSMVTFHRLVAEIKTKMGLPRAARQSVATARSLLDSWPNVAQQGFLAVTSSAIEFMQSDFEAALRYSKEALTCAVKSGSCEIYVPAIGNLAHIKLAQGRLKEASEAVADFLKVVVKGGSTEIAGLDTQMEIALAADDLEAAASLGTQVATTSNNLDSGNSFHGLWNLLTQVRLRYRLQQTEAGLAMALEAIPRIIRLGDQNLLSRMQLLAAEGYGRTGQASMGAKILADAVKSHIEPALQILGEIARVRGVSAARESSTAATVHFQQASAIFQTIGHFVAKSNVDRDVADLLNGSARRVASSTAQPSALRPPEQSNHASSADVVDRVASVLAFSEYPPLMAKEVMSLLASTGAISKAEIGERAPSASVSLSDSVVDLRVGDYGDRQVFVSAEVKPTASARTTVLAIEQLVSSALSIARARQERREQAAFWPEATPEQELGLIFSSDRMRDLLKVVRRAASVPLSVLVMGETGVGKELLARALHLASPRKDKLFLPFNCASFPKDMLDSQLFGHRKGSFTGAHETNLGVIRAAAGGTLFLDEIGEMSLEAQPKLLRFLESGEIHPLGEPKPTHVDVRIVAATNANLEQLVSEGKFREDLFYRLNVMPIHIPPLRERREEVPALVEHFIDKFGREMQKLMIRVADDTLEYLLLYRWPGNVRQLANEIRRMVALAEPGAMLTPAHLSREITGSRRTVAVEPSEFVMRLDQPLADATDQLERAAIERAMTAANGNNDQAARILGLSRKGLYLKRQRLGLK